MTGEGRGRESLVLTSAINLVLLFALLLPFVLVGSGGWLLYQREFGEKVDAKVISCDFDIGYRTSEQHCLARWKQDGVTHVAPIQASGEQQVGETIPATVHGDQLYSRSVALPLILIGLGLPLCWFPISWVRNRLQRT